LVRKGKCDVERELQEWLRGAGRVVVVGVGNPIRMDDFVGVKIVQDLKGRVNTDWVMLIEAETVPENHMQEIIEFEPTHILMIDAAVLGLGPGGAKLMKSEQLTDFPAISTHILPLRIFCDCLKTANAEVGLLLVEPEKTDFGEGMTSKVEAVSRTIHEMLLELLS
jgi:hydrogenase 3 maturation protease